MARAVTSISGAGDMDVVRAFNNNVILAVDDDGGEVILTGRGLGFQARPGAPVDESKVIRKFVPSDTLEVNALAQMLAGIQPEHVHLVVQAISDVGLSASNAVNPALVIAIADHVSFAVRRLSQGLAVEYPLLGEVKNLYAEEYAQAMMLLTALNKLLERPLPETEAVALTLHLVNAGFTTSDLPYTHTMTGLIRQILAVIEQGLGIALDVDSVNIGRFIVHLRYLFVRIHQHAQLDERHSTIGAAIRESYPQALEYAQRLAQLIELRLGSELTDDEVSYLTLHIARVSEDAGVRQSGKG